jgi:hypothetical protein
MNLIVRPLLGRHVDELSQLRNAKSFSLPPWRGKGRGWGGRASLDIARIIDSPQVTVRCDKLRASHRDGSPHPPCPPLLRGGVRRVGGGTA